MNTVKHFKDLGLEFVGNDMVDCSNTSIPDFENIKGYESNVNNPEFGWDEQIVGEFAWRKNTGEVPAFKGEIEVELQSGETMTGITRHFVWRTRAGAHQGNITQWRPLLTQLKSQPEKPVYTQEMADAKALVPVGAEYRIDSETFLCVAHHGVDAGFIGENVNGELRHHDHCQQTILPLKTQRDIEIDLICEMIGETLNGATKENDFERLHKMGYRVTKVKE